MIKGEAYSLRAMLIISLLAAQCVVVFAHTQHLSRPREGAADASRTVPDFITRHGMVITLK